MKNDVFEYDNFYHIYNRGNNSENIFIENKNYDYFLLLLQKYLNPIAEIYAYCLLKNHFHLVLKIKNQNEISYKGKIHQPFSNLFNAYSKAINKSYNRNGSLFQEHLKRKRILNEDYLKNLILYVHLNPVKHNFIDNFTEYKHSSYKRYFNENNFNIEKDFIIKLFDGLENFKFQHQEKKIQYDEIIKSIEEIDI